MTHSLSRSSNMLINIIISFLLIANFSWAISLDKFYPFGTKENDQELKPSNYSSGFLLNISGNFIFRSTRIQTVVVSCWSKNTCVADVHTSSHAYFDIECARTIMHLDTVLLSGCINSYIFVWMIL